MESVTVSTKYQVVIPLRIRKLLGVKAGQKMQVIAYDNRVVLIPFRPIQEARGSLQGMNTEDFREETDEARP
ncbi:MAG TPA: AbrB/MazE/SpoVT family DNA-binding domain-containing protein [Anaerolineales bacterium]|nr:AbrB/MazE/SpoVT family DNA-binding domain-containing protein [Anaerolineales bacterium]